MCQNCIEQKHIRRYEVALATRNFEIELFWKRSLFFWGFIASAFVGYAALIKDKPSLAVVLACFGFVCTVAWSFANRGSKRWQENWEKWVNEFEEEVTGKLFQERRYKSVNALWLGSRRFSVSKLTIALSDFTILIWLSILTYHLLKLYSVSWELHKNELITAAICGSIIFVIFMLLSGRSSDWINFCHISWATKTYTPAYVCKVLILSKPSLTFGTLYPAVCWIKIAFLSRWDSFNSDNYFSMFIEFWNNFKHWVHMHYSLKIYEK